MVFFAHCDFNQKTKNTEPIIDFMVLFEKYSQLLSGVEILQSDRQTFQQNVPPMIQIAASEN
jgi:hypothetical protein